MKVLVLSEYPAPAAGLALQGELLCRGLSEMGVDVYPVHLKSDLEKEWYYRWFRPDVVVGVGFWGHIPDLVLHPQQFGMLAVPWLVADGYIAEHRDVLNALPLILVTSNWVKEVYVRDGIRGDNIVVLPVGCGTDRYRPHSHGDVKVQSIRKEFGISKDQLMILTAGGDGASKGAREVMRALAMIDAEAPDWKYVCKVWPQARTERQNLIDLKLAADLGIGEKVTFSTNVVSQNFMPYLLSACDIYAAPSRLPTSDWRDEQYVMGYGLYVNMIVYAYLRLFGEHESAECLRGLMSRLEVSADLKNSYEQEALVEPTAPYYALYSYKVMSNDRFDLLGNSLAILTGIASPQCATKMLTWIEAECEAMRGRGELMVDLPPCLFPYILPHHADWLPRYERYNRPGDYHNGGVWPFICGFYVAACVAAGQMDLAERKLLALTELVKPWHEDAAEWGFNEWIHAQTGKPSGRDWQTWSAAMYRYAAECVLRRGTPFFDIIRGAN